MVLNLAWADFLDIVILTVAGSQNLANVFQLHSTKLILQVSQEYSLSAV